MALSFEWADGAHAEWDALVPSHHGAIGELIAVLSRWCMTGEAPGRGARHAGGIVLPLYSQLPGSQIMVMVHADALRLKLLSAGEWNTPAEQEHIVARGLRRLRNAPRK